VVKARSPGYPSISLGEAVDKITLVYKNDYQNKIPRPVVAQHAGYNSMNGRALSVLASLSKYGLLEGRGEENWVSDLALHIIAHAPKSEERAKAIQEAADFPDLFKEISERFPGGVSEVALKSYLLTRKFIPDAADTVARCYRETRQFVLDETAAYATLQGTNEEQGPLRLQHDQVIDKPNQNFGMVASAGGFAGARGISGAIISTVPAEQPLKLNEPKLALEGQYLRIEAWVDAKGLKRLQKMIAANAPLLENDDEDGELA
jgi:hypothetical protein